MCVQQFVGFGVEDGFDQFFGFVKCDGFVIVDEGKVVDFDVIVCGFGFFFGQVDRGDLWVVIGVVGD